MKTIYRHITIALLLSLIFTAGGLQAGAQTVTATFDDGLPEGWSVEGSVTNNSDRARSGKGLFSSAKADKTNYIITTPMEGDIEFWARSYNTRGYGYVTLYAVNDDNTLGDKIHEFRTDNVDRAPVNFTKYTYTLPSAGRVAIDLYWACIDDFTYTPVVEYVGPALKIEGFASGSSYDFGGEPVKAGTAATFSLSNPGSETLNISSVSVTGGYTITEGAGLTSLLPQQTAQLTVVTPANDATGVLTIVSDAADSPYTINLSSTLKPASPEMEVDTESIDFGVATDVMTHPVTIRNSGDAELQVSLASDNSRFTISPRNANINPGQSATFTVTYKYSATDYGYHTGNIMITNNADDPLLIPVSVSVKNPYTWSEHFDGNALPDGWEAGDKWSFADGVAKATYDYYNKNSQLTTPALIAKKGETLSFRYKATANYVTIKITGSKDGGSFTELGTISTDKMTDFDTYVISDLAAGTWRFSFNNDDYELDDFEGLILNSNAPRMEITPATPADFGKVSSAPQPFTYTVSNTGTGKMSVLLSSDSDDFTVSPSTLTDIEPGTPKTFTVSYNYDIANLGRKTANINVVPTYGENDQVTIAASAIAIDPNVWMEDFEEGEIPSTWDNQGAWTAEVPTYAGSNGTVMASVRSMTSVSLTTPRLHANQGDILSFYIGMQYDDEPLVIEYSTDDKTTWSLIDLAKPLYNESADLTFQAPVEGHYYLRFTGTYAMLDNFVGFQLALREYELSLEATDIPAQGYQYSDYSPSVTVKEMAGKATNATARLLIDGNEVATAAQQEIAPFATATFTFAYEPTQPVLNSVARIEVYYGDAILSSADVNISIAAAPIFDEDATIELTEGNIPAGVIRYTPVNGWNTIAMPFALTDEVLNEIFGDGYEAYEYYSTSDNAIKFRKCNHFVAGYPYLVYASAIENGNTTNIIIKDVEVQSVNGKYDENSGIRFQATLKPCAAAELEGDYIIDPENLDLISAGEGLQGYRAYFIIDEEATGSGNFPYIEVYKGDGSVINGIETVEIAETEKTTIYDLSGRRLQTTPRGICILNGKKVVVR